MTVKECYDIMRGNYEEAAGRLVTEERIKKFLLKFPNDLNFCVLCEALEARNMQEAFRAAHTLKRICLNLSINGLWESVNKMTEALRNRESYGEDLEPLLQKVKEDYNFTISCIDMLDK